MTELSTPAFRSIGEGAAIAEGAVVPYYLTDQKTRIAVARLGGRLFAFDDLCTCDPQRCPLSGGLLDRRTILCQCHGSRFDVATGAVVRGPATEALGVYEVRELDGDVRLRI
jgi:3-phenylpropionate/trans-cinnamate dioxygenase ferredoxin component